MPTHPRHPSTRRHRPRWPAALLLAFAATVSPTACAAASPADDSAHIAELRELYALQTRPREVPDRETELPRVYVEVKVPAVTGTSRRVRAGESLQAAIDAAQPGDEIVLDPGATYTGPFTLRKKSGSGWILIRTAGSLPASGTRVTPAQASQMPKLVSSDQYKAVIRTEPGAHHYYLLGLEITAPSTHTQGYSLIDLGSGNPDQYKLEHVPSDIVLDRLYVHGTPTYNFRRCIALNSARTAIVDSYISECHARDADSQAILGYNGTGPYKIVNNFLEGAGENVMFGGGDPKIQGALPRDIEIRRNHFYKPTSWKGVWMVKNLLELKIGQRVLVEGNIFENNWADGQTGFAILFKSVNQEGRAPWSETSDVTFRYNLVKNVAGAVSLAGRPESQTAVPASRMTFVHNVFQNVGPEAYPNGKLFQIGKLTDLVIDHNTGISAHSALYMVAKGNDRLTVTDNVFGETRYGIIADGNGMGTKALDAMAPGWKFEGNVLAGGDVGRFPRGNHYPGSTLGIGFANLARGDLRLKAPGRWTQRGMPPGADMEAVLLAIEGVASPVR